mgnify:CR=1 FL=1|tara:strand:- start:10574 stop:11326 length:753 start_codon:yes stop_codon:yes gene_type:complete
MLAKQLLATVKRAIKLSNTKRENAATAYDTWAHTYDDEKNNGNLTVFYNDILIAEMLQNTALKDKIVLDIGAGTGRHYPALKVLQPKKYIACDVSDGMLQKFNAKFPEAETHLITENTLNFANDKSVDVLFSSLTIGHVQHIDAFLQEWNRVLAFNGTVLLTLFHPSLSHLKEARSFKDAHENLHIIEHYEHNVVYLKKRFATLSWEVISFSEKEIDSLCFPLLTKMNLQQQYDAIVGKKIVCGFLLRKK